MVILSRLYCLIVNQLRCGVMVVIVFLRKKKGEGKKRKKKCKKSVTTITSGHMPTNSMLQPIPLSLHLTSLRLKIIQYNITSIVCSLRFRYIGNIWMMQSVFFIDAIEIFHKWLIFKQSRRISCVNWTNSGQNEKKSTG